MKKFILVAAMILVTTNANAGWFDSDHDKLINNIIECAKKIAYTDDMSCSTKIMSDVKKMKKPSKNEKVELPKGVTQKQLDGYTMLIAMADMCNTNPKTTKKKTLANITKGDFACGMLSNVKQSVKSGKNKLFK